MNSVIDKFVEVLSTQPDPILTPHRIGYKKPSSTSDIPAIVISLNIENYSENGIGRFIRAANTVVESSSVIDVSAASQMFSSDFKSLRIMPLPLRKNPSSVKKKFTENDVQIRNVTESIQPVEYTMTDEPKQKGDFKLDVPRAIIAFGEAQTEGEKLEVNHWTVEWRNEILGDRYEGLMILEIWTNDFNKANEISHSLQDKLKVSRAEQRQKGFLKLQPAYLEPVENIRHDTPIGSPFSVWKQTIGYKFAFETQSGGELSSGIPINRIDVDIDENLNETFSIQ